ncbi:MAG: sialidase family protein [Planctomycetota bacterium]|nr:sialidase family protein [Planctomycetota bacterium]
MKLLAVLALSLVCASSLAEDAVLSSGLIYENAPFPSCHASTIAESGAGLVAAWFGGTDEGNKDVGIWVSRKENGKWSPPMEVADGVQAPGKRHPCWNPVLFQPKKPAGSPLLLFFKVGPSPSTWWGELISSKDGGRTWTKQRRLGKGVIGPVKNKPIELDKGVLLCPSSTEHAGWKVHFEFSPDQGRTWSSTGNVNKDKRFGAIQPTIFQHADGRLQALCRSQQGRLTQTWSSDMGKTWSEMSATSLPNPNAGADGVTLSDGRHLLVYNHTTRALLSRPRGREMLNVALSSDGKEWQAALVLENQRGEHSYPAVIQAADGLVHITYTYHRRRVKHVVVDPKKLKLQPIKQGKWPNLAGK